MATRVLRSGGWADRVLVSVAFVTVVGTDAAYVEIIRSQPGGPPPDVEVAVPIFVTFYLVAMALLLAASLAEVSPLAKARPALRAAASAGLLVMGVLAAFSIGVPLLLAGMVAVASTILSLTADPTRRPWVGAAVAAVAAVAVLVIGFQASWNYIQCPASGQTSGSTAGFFSSSSYTCNGGQLTITSP